MKILLFGGTTEGRILAQWLAEKKIQTTVCVATEYGGTLLPQGIEGQVGRMSTQEMTGKMAEGYTQIIDATHPYAVDVTKNIRDASCMANLPLWRLVRETEETQGDWQTVADMSSAIVALEQIEGNILLTTGSKDLHYFTGAGMIDRCYPRVLPVMDSIERCLSLGFSPSHIIGMQGPFSVQMNEALIAEFQIKTVVTKASGSTGGFFEKVQAACHTGCRLIVIARPIEETGDTLSDICGRLEGICG